MDSHSGMGYLGCPDCENGMGVLPGDSDFVGPLSPEEQAYADSQASVGGMPATNILPPGFVGPLAPGESYAPSAPGGIGASFLNSISQTFEANAPLFLVVGALILVAMSSSKGRR